ncbi:MAG TPA: DUF1287 domain-containing protein [Mesorhizobium sp.]|jgi:uncharacterized protein YijF (DUF1287 family)|uniref:DUF1287 domain-containing protein n=1 Tax=Mesorhizobium sp. TaxID=1871066 RepID=UPI002DDC9F98|nr:DUF1287 domain-containing protein [Mesorhizobium sp.]HEV2506668.1 DUF1287 domain-containing protein [Mesorhizobium sp.]
MIDRRTVLKSLALATCPALLTCPASAAAQSQSWTERLVDAAFEQIGVTVIYDPAYVRLDYPGGDVPVERGVCTDVVVRAYRKAFNVDLQRLVNEDMRAAFSAYPTIWGRKQPDPNIDHRRVPNLETFFKRKGAGLEIVDDAAAYRPGDLITQRLPGNLPHIAIVTGRMTSDGQRPLVVHNIGAGARVEDTLFAFRIAGHFRFSPEV